MAYFGVIFFANMGGGGGQNYFQRVLLRWVPGVLLNPPPGGPITVLFFCQNPQEVTFEEPMKRYSWRDTLTVSLVYLTVGAPPILFPEEGFSDQSCRNGRFGKRSFCPLPGRKQVVLTKVGENSDIAFYTKKKQGILLLKAWKSTKMTGGWHPGNMTVCQKNRFDKTDKKDSCSGFVRCSFPPAEV